jgi:hypothetical protein
LGPAINTLQAARQLGSLPATDEAMRDGRLSETQVKEIAGAAIHQPGAEQELVDAAGNQPLTMLKLRCRRVRAGGKEQSTTYDTIRRQRYLRNWIDGEGAVRLDARLTPDEGARLIAAVTAEADRLANQARRVGHDESRKAFAADALVRLASGHSPTSVQTATPAGRADGGRRSGRARSEPVTMVHVRVDHQALVRGHLEPGEICEIPGVGPIPVEVARRLAVDSILSVLVTDGVDVTAVAHTGRTIPASVRRALIERDQVCVVPGCDLGDGLEIDHVEPFGQGGETSLANLARLCHWHHYLKTYQRHRLQRVDGAWRWTMPGDAGPQDAGPATVLSG